MSKQLSTKRWHGGMTDFNVVSGVIADEYPQLKTIRYIVEDVRKSDTPIKISLYNGDEMVAVWLLLPGEIVEVFPRKNHTVYTH